MIFARAVLAELGVTDRRVWCCDSFEGLPTPDVDEFPVDLGDPHHTFEWLRVSLETVQTNFRRYGLLDDQVRFVKGWFRDTLPAIPVEQLAVLRLDGDMYESTWQALFYLYPKLSPGGFLIVDDWSLARARQAVNDYRTRHKIVDQVRSIDPFSVFWRKSA